MQTNTYSNNTLAKLRFRFSIENLTKSITLKLLAGRSKPNDYQKVLSGLFSELNIRISDVSLRDSLKDSVTHLASPLEMIPSALKEWGIKATPMQADLSQASYESLVDELPCPCLIICKHEENADDLIAITNIEGGEIEIIDARCGLNSITYERLMDVWEMGYMLAIDTSRAINQPDYESKQKMYNRPRQFQALGVGLVMAMFAGLAFHGFQKNDLLWRSLFMLNGLGAFISLMLAAQYLSGQNHLLSKVCGKGETSHCDRVLQHGSAALWGIPHADIGLVFFFGILGVLVLQPAEIWLVCSFSVLPLGYAIYSIFFQAFVAKAWCRVCLAVQAIILIQAWVVFTLAGVDTVLGAFPIPSDSLLSSLIIFLLPASFWFQVRKGIQLEKVTEEPKVSPQTFLNDLSDAERIETEMGARDITVGTVGADTRLTVLLSIHCPHCRSALDEIITLTETAAWPIEIRIRIASIRPLNREGNSAGAKEKQIYDVALAIMALTLFESDQAALQALNSWYKEGRLSDCQSWLDQQRTFSESELQAAEESLQKIVTWTQENQLNFTPLFFLDGYQLDENYSVNDIFIALRKILPLFD